MSMDKLDIVIKLMEEQKENNKEEHKRIEAKIDSANNRPMLTTKQITAIGGIVTTIVTGLTVLVKMLLGV